ncbi:MAG: glutaminyl-peptide cyclotransferase [Bacteroidetes bacterium]|nr:glutaminyl-peptide cyclotransferase [Bacteroidota bacterium]
MVACLAGMLWVSSCKNSGTDKAEHKADTSAAAQGPAVMQYQVVKEYPHSGTAFTEGLQYVDGILYESTGEYGSSELRKVELSTGKVLASRKMDEKYFGEGLAVLNGKVYQLTYREHTGFIYDAKTLKPEGTFSFNTDEGWGMTTDGRHLIYDDGKNLLHYLEPGTFKEIKTLHVNDENGAVDEINELECIGAFIYANQWKTGNILKIDTTTGQVVARADLSALVNQARSKVSTDASSQPDVMNGIAYDAANNKIYVTGKNWQALYEVKLDN